MKSPIIDLHSHILPGMDDGSKTIEESIEMLKMMKDQGVTTVLATPHFYHPMSVEGFLKRRQNAYEMLINSELYTTDLPKIVLGAEVQLEYNMHQELEMDKLCIDGTDYILIELPLTKINDWVFEELFRISSKYNVNIILAHIERYNKKFLDNVGLLKLKEMDYLFQVNVDCIKQFIGKSVQHKYIKYDIADFIGSDCHNTDSRKPCMGKAKDYIIKRMGQDKFDELMRNSEKMLNNEVIY